MFLCGGLADWVLHLTSVLILDLSQLRSDLINLCIESALSRLEPVHFILVMLLSERLALISHLGNVQKILDVL